VYGQYGERSPRGKSSERRNRSPRNRSTRDKREGKTDMDRSRERSPTRREGGSKTVVNTISGGFSGDGPSRLARKRKRHLRAIKSVHMISRRTCRNMPEIIFPDRDFKGIDTRQDDPMVITVDLANCEIKKMLVDYGSSVDVLYWRTFKKMGLDESEIIPLDEQIVRFLGERVDTKGYIDLHTKFGEPA